jgi:hypothetical protein
MLEYWTLYFTFSLHIILWNNNVVDKIKSLTILWSNWKKTKHFPFSIFVQFASTFWIFVVWVLDAMFLLSMSVNGCCRQIKSLEIEWQFEVKIKTTKRRNSNIINTKVAVFHVLRSYMYRWSKKSFALLNTQSEAFE